MISNLKNTTTTVGMLAEDVELNSGQADTTLYTSEEQQIKQPEPKRDPFQNIWVDPAISSALGQVENKPPEVKDEGQQVGTERTRNQKGVS